MTDTEPSDLEVLVTFSPEEYALISEHAAELSVPIAAYVRQAATRGARDEQLKRQLLQEAAQKQDPAAEPRLITGLLIDDILDRDPTTLTEAEKESPNPGSRPGMRDRIHPRSPRPGQRTLGEERSLPKRHVDQTHEPEARLSGAFLSSATHAHGFPSMPGGALKETATSLSWAAWRVDPPNPPAARTYLRSHENGDGERSSEDQRCRQCPVVLGRCCGRALGRVSKVDFAR
jgi:hypothetical protein